ncbi:DUF3576 domain-containing protein [Candidatus Pelagibacter sp.]|nr:DUF3576 domain-containing protein [Candidatus Pelagibacter sp.]
MKKNLIKLIALFFFTSFFLSSCGIYKRADVKDTPINVDERVKKNIQEGRGIRFGKGATRGGDFDFASSNPLWRSAVDVLDFVPLTNASYSGGIIITEWFSSENNTESTNRELKITVRFMSNEIRADAIKVLVFEKSCVLNNCKTKKIKSKLEGELKLAILKKAALFENEDFKKYKETKGKDKAKRLIKKK